MRIIENGKPGRALRVFCCPDCECKFAATPGEYEYWSQVDTGKSGGGIVLRSPRICRCPECKSMAEEVDR